MPCRDWDDDNKVYDAALRNDVCALKEALAKAPKSSLLCEACALLEEAGLLAKASPELKAWYKQHEACEADKVRIEAAEKLSERERRLLGIDLAELKRKAK
jgi:hypothetical protein